MVSLYCAFADRGELGFVLSEDIAAAGPAASMQAFIVDGNNLGIAYWCLAPLYKLCHARLGQLRAGLRKDWQGYAR